MKPMEEMSESEKMHFLECWERLRDGVATEAEVKEVHERLGEGEGAKRWLAEAILLETELRFDGESLKSQSKVEPVQVVDVKGWRVLRWSHAAAAGVAALLSWGVWQATQVPAAAVATLVKAQSCKWGNSALPTLEGSALVPGTLELVEGMATVLFSSGAEVVLEAPVSLEIVSSMEARVQRGTVVAEVPPQAKGFTIQTADTKVVDFGTKFGVSASEDGKCLVQVIEGLVEVNRKGESEVKALRSGERVDYGGMTQSKLNPDADRQQAEPGRWLPAAAMTDLGDGWQVVTTAFGEGKDSWIQSNAKQRVTGGETFLRVKHTTLDRSLERKMYLAFDLSKLEGGVEEAELVLHLEPSELGYGSLVPDATFDVYGLTDESEDRWEEGLLRWERAPAHNESEESHSRPDMAKARLLGSFRVEQGRQSGAVSLKDPALADFLRLDSNGVVTLIVCRETNELARNGLVHAFASKENARNAPPMLRVRVSGE
jgi:hypothetical protein